jgi:uncharacterized protein (TIGR00297 family)
MNLLRLLFAAPAADWIRFALFLTGILFFIFLAEKTRTRLRWSAEVTRKLVHVGTGVLIVLSPLLFSSPKPLLWMAVLFIVVNFAGVESGKLKGMHDTTRKSYGTVFFPLTFLVLVATCWNGHKTVLILSMMVLSFSDAAAATVGELLHKPHEYRLGKDKKSIEGSSAMFAVSVLLIALGLPILASGDGLSIPHATALWIALVSATVATALEALSSGGSDNLSAPLGTAIVLSLMMRQDGDLNVRLTAGLLLAAVVALASHRVRFLAADGTVTTFVLAFFVFGIGGWTWGLPILAFFVTSSLLSRMGKLRKKRLESVSEKTGTRDAGQVLANGGIAGILVVLHGLFPNPAWYPLYLGALAAVNADTWATEIGTFSKARPVLITTGRCVPAGTSGGVSLLGLAGALAGAAVIAGVGIAFIPLSSGFKGAWEPGRLLFAVTAAGFLAGLVDSVLGATVQAQNACPACGRTTEKRIHCGGRETRLASGFRLLNNDWVNGICGFAGAVLVWALLRMGPG